MNVRQTAVKLREMSVAHQGEAALQELSSLTKMEQLAVIKELLHVAKQEHARVYIDKSQRQLVFDLVCESTC